MNATVYNYGTLEARIVNAAQRRLGLNSGDVRFVEWIRKATGDVPVLCVPAQSVPEAKQLGLTVIAA